ncbi:CLUMA_CG011274, isoform A [Clunio marinus]|uniref:CLUMA_CG011274, isoform A n=1 Tax=Clunio marinus TaxID=568069 RepID=A0A1J1ICH5_9DIPT|nr:CLUMA_CG011274, isoform A [Clunio marinus]
MLRLQLISRKISFMRKVLFFCDCHNAHATLSVIYEVYENYHVKPHNSVSILMQSSSEDDNAENILFFCKN